MATNGTQSSPWRRFFLYSNIHIPVIAIGLISSTCVVLKIEFSWALAVLSSAGAFVIYQVDRAWISSPEDVVNQPGRVEWYQHHHSYTKCSLGLGLLLGLLATFFLDFNTIWLAASLGVVGLMYLIPFGSHLSRLKGRLWAKPLFITLCWAYGGVILPIVESGNSIDEKGWSFFLYRSLLIAANVLLSDLPDQKGDAESKLITLAVLLSKKGLIQVVICFSIVTLLAGVVQGIAFNWPIALFTDLVGAFLMILLAFKALQKDVPHPHVTFGYINDLIIGWPLISVGSFYLIEGLN